MHLLESYSLTAGVPISTPNIQSKFFPLPFDKYIVLHTTTKPAKTYDYYDAVLSLLLPILNEAGIRIVEIGTGDQQPQKGTHSVMGRTSITQTFYLIKNALLVLGADSVALHAAGVYNVPIVGLYANTNYVDCIKPYFGTKNKQILMECEKDGKKPSFSVVEQPKSINTIKPEDVVKNVCKLLNLPFNFPYETVMIGEAFRQTFIESVPNQTVKVENFGDSVILMRMDCCFNEQNLIDQGQVNKLAIITDKPISLDTIKVIRPRLVEILYEIKEDSSPEWIAEIVKLGIRITLFTFLPDEALNKIKLAYLDLPLIVQKQSKKPEKLNTVPNKDLFISTNRFILSDEKVFPSTEHWRKGTSVPDFGFHITPLGDSDDFYKEDGCYWYLRKI